MSAWHHNAAWQSLRMAALRRDGWRCRRCGSKLRLEVDHVERVERRPDLALSLDNLQTLCAKCHIDKTRHERGGASLPGAAEWRTAVRALTLRKV